MANPKCEVCKVDVGSRCDSKHPKVRFCSPQCTKSAWYRRRKPVPVITDNICQICDSVFTPDLFHPNAKTCSKKCLGRMDYLQNRERYALKAKEWLKNNPEKRREIHRRYYKRNIIKKRAEGRARSTGHISLLQWKTLCKKSHNLCQHCKTKSCFKTLSIDHIIPISLGGGNEIGNLQPLCLKCNQKKGNRYIG